MKILVFLHGTVIMHRAGLSVSREERVAHVKHREQSVHEYDTYVPINYAVKKLKHWVVQGAEIVYLSSHESINDVEKDKLVISKYKFPDGEIFYRKDGETYGNVVSRILPDVLIEDDCESIGGKPEMTYPNLRPELQRKIKSIVVNEFAGIDDLSDDIGCLIKD